MKRIKHRQTIRTEAKAKSPESPVANSKRALPGRHMRLSLAHVLLVSLLMASAGLFAYSVLCLVAPTQTAINSTSLVIATLMDIGDSLCNDIRRVIVPAMNRTRKLAASRELVEALQSHDLARLTAVCNNGVLDSTEIDALALFDRDGRICAINSVYANGKPIDRDRIDRILGMNFSNREIITHCTSNNARQEALEFQTHCDITPAFFDSTGLSIAYSLPVIAPETGEQVGIISTRMRFDRLIDLIQKRHIGGVRDSIQFVADNGDYFSEDIVVGRCLPPVPSHDIAQLIAPLVKGATNRVLVHHGNMVLLFFRLDHVATLDGGGIQVMLVAGDDWIAREARQDQLLIAGIAALIGALLLLIAISLRAVMTVLRDRRIIIDQKLELEREMSMRLSAEAERARLAESLVEASRTAGMAEIATSILHNVGNALNSANVSTNLIKERVEGLKIGNLSKASTLINENTGRLGPFLDADEAGKRLPGYLTKLAESMECEQTAILTEIGVLAERIEHIKTIVNTQHEYSTTKCLTETVSIVEVVEGALGLHLSHTERLGISVSRDYSDLPPVQTDKHKLGQILLTLIDNAIQAMSMQPESLRVLTLRARINDDRLQIEIGDTGTGIAKENLTRIFSYGFTTKKNSRGFGLHDSANAAKEMGGSLTVHSDGRGAGAIFRIELPLHPVEAHQ